MLTRPDDDPARAQTVAPGLYRFAGAEPGGGDYPVVWWDPRELSLGTAPPAGLRRDDLIAKDGDQLAVEKRMADYRAWERDRDVTVARASVPSVRVVTATDLARSASIAAVLAGPTEPIQIVDLSRAPGRPFGPLFGSLVHAVLATVPLDADSDTVAATARTQARVLGAPEDDSTAAAAAVTNVLRHELFDAARAAAARGACSREEPILWLAPDGTLVEGTVDLAFRDDHQLTVVDFKTDRDPLEDVEPYARQLQIYCRALSRPGERVALVLVRV